jgi:hypothetical protein
MNRREFLAVGAVAVLGGGAPAVTPSPTTTKTLVSTLSGSWFHLKTTQLVTQRAGQWSCAAPLYEFFVRPTDEPPALVARWSTGLTEEMTAAVCDNVIGRSDVDLNAFEAFSDLVACNLVPGGRERFALAWRDTAFAPSSPDAPSLLSCLAVRFMGKCSTHKWFHG